MIFVHGCPSCRSAGATHCRASPASASAPWPGPARLRTVLDLPRSHELRARTDRAATCSSSSTRSGRDRAVSVGHDWGSPVVWSLASHHPERCHAVASLCVPYLADGFTPAALVPLIDRRVTRRRNSRSASGTTSSLFGKLRQGWRQTFEADPRNTLKALFERATRKARASRHARPTCGRRVAGSAGRPRRPTCRSIPTCSPSTS